MTAMFQCLEAVEQNDPKLLAQVDTVGVGLIVVNGLNVLEKQCFFCSFFKLYVLSLLLSLVNLKASKQNRHW